MQDMLVKLYSLPDYSSLKEKLEQSGIRCRRPLSAEKSIVFQWVQNKFGTGWASEVDVSFSYQPNSCFIAVKENQIIGFSC